MEKKIELTDGKIVAIRAIWNGENDKVEIYDEDENYISDIKGTIPDVDDEEACADFIKKIEEEIAWAEH